MLKTFYSSLLAGTLLLCFCETGIHATESAPVRIDLRVTDNSNINLITGWLIISGTERVSPVAKVASDSATLTINNEKADGWSTYEPNFDSTKTTDRWYAFKLTENGTEFTKSLLVLNGVALHEGVLESDETWGNSKVHVVRDVVRVPSGKTLTISNGAIVKFCDDADIMVDEGGTLTLGSSVLTHIADDEHGGNTNYIYKSTMFAADSLEFTFNGALNFIGDPEVLYAKENERLKNCSVAVEGCTVNRKDGHIVGAIVTVTENLKLDNAEKYYDFNWSSDQGVEFASSDATTTFAMPGKDVAIACTAELKDLEDSDSLSVLRIQPGWNLLTIRRPLTTDDAERFLALHPLALDADNMCYARCAEPSQLAVGAGYWLFSFKARDIVLEHGQGAGQAIGLADGWNLIGAEGSNWPVAASLILKWGRIMYMPVKEEQVTEGRAYWALP